MPPLVLGVHVVRELNLDADRLSHPRQLADVMLDAGGSWRRVTRVRVHNDEWDDLRAAIAANDGGGSLLPPAADAPSA